MPKNPKLKPATARSKKTLSIIFPFKRWFDLYSTNTLRLDFLSGITVALVLIPQSMAYAQLAGLPPYYGLYAAFLPPIIAAMWGSSYQLSTGPVAIVSLMTAATLAPLASLGGQQFIEYAILLALMIGLFQLSLGLLRLGVVVNFLSHPVVNGFTNAAAIIIATSQLPKLFGVHIDNYEHHYETIYYSIVGAIHFTHWATLLFALFAFAIMYGIRFLNRRLPNVLIAVVITTLLSYFTGYEKNFTASIDQLVAPDVRELIDDYNEGFVVLDSLTAERVRISTILKDLKREPHQNQLAILDAKHNFDYYQLQITQQEENNRGRRVKLRSFLFSSIYKSSGDSILFYSKGQEPVGGKRIVSNWRMKVGNQPVNVNSVKLVGGGDVIGNIPKGLPKVNSPRIDFSVLGDLIPMAIIISLLGFMEAISIAKAMAAKTGQRLDPNQELIGQGFSNIVGSFSSCYPVSGSFSRSAVNLQSGAVTGMSSVFSSVVVMVTLLFFTPLLYHLPQSVLAAIIMMAVIGLINVKGFIHAYQAQKYDGIIAMVTFVVTLIFAPHLDKGIMIGVSLSLGHYLYRNIKPDMAILSKYVDGTFRKRGAKRAEKMPPYCGNPV